MAVPKLRFKADDGSDYPNLEETKLDTLMAFKNGINASGDKFGRGTKCISVMDILNNSCITYDVIKGEIDVDEKTLQNFTVEYGDAVFQRSSENVQDAGRANVYMDKDRPATFSGFVIRGKRIANYEPMFMNGLLNTFSVRKQIMSKAQGAQHINIGQEILSSVRVNMPSLPEQQKIAEFLSTIDTVIEKQKETVSAWEERKKGVMQKLFSQEVRFKADDGSDFPEWEEKKLSEIFKKVIEKNRLDLPPLTIVQGYGTIRRDESERRIAYDEKGLKNYKAVQKDDFIVHLRSFEGGLEIANQDGIVSPAYHVYRGNDEVHPSFYYPYFRSSSFIKGKLAICVTGVRDGKNIEMGSFDELLIPHPCLAEQQKIADCLSSLDEVIEKQKATSAAWEELKKGLLQQMFV